MGIIKGKRKCDMCLGDGQIGDVNAIPPTNAPCPQCGATGIMRDLEYDTTGLEEKLDYIHGKVTAIWNAVKPPN